MSFSAIKLVSIVISVTHTNKTGSHLYSGADKSLAQPGMKQATATEDFDVHVSYL